MPDCWITQQEVMRQTGLSYRSVISRRKNGTFRSVKHSNRWWINITAFFQDLEQKEKKAQAKVIHLFAPSSEVDLEEHIKRELKIVNAKIKNKS